MESCGYNSNINDYASSKPFNKISIFEACEQHVAPDGFTTERLNRIQEYNIEILEIISGNVFMFRTN